MPKSTSKDQPEDASLKRRPIRTGPDGLKNSPSKSEKLYPELPVEDEMELIEEEDRDEVVDQLYKAEYHNIKRGKSPENTMKSPKKNEKIKFWNQIYFKLILIAICVITFLKFFVSSEPVTDLSLKGKLKNMQDRFQDQNVFTFRILQKALEKVVNVTNEPSAPAIFTVTVNKNAIYKSHEFSHYLANALAPQNTVFINESMSWHSQPDKIKFKIDSEIQSKATNKSFFVVIVDNLQNIPLKGAMIFHSYCDHEAAPFKQAVFLFIVPLNEILPNNTSTKKIDKAAFQQFKNIWKNASPDEIDSLITRITVNVINIS